MTKEMICITCPNGCKLTVEETDGNVTVSGNKCLRGEAFAIGELTRPMRTICSTVRTIYNEVPVIPVRVTEEIPKSRIFDVMGEINSITVSEPLGRGDAVINNILGLGVDIIVTSNVLRDFLEGEGKHE